MDRLEQIIREEARQVPVGLLDLLRSMPASVEDISAGELASWSRGFLRSLFVENDAAVFEPGIGPVSERHRTKLLHLLSMHLRKAPMCSQTKGKQLKLSSALLWEAWRHHSSVSEGLHPKSASFAWFVLQTESVAAATVLTANGLSRSKACKEVAKLLKLCGLETSAETIRRDWYKKCGDSALYHDTSETLSLPRRTIAIWLEDLRNGEWLEIEPARRPDFIEFAVVQRHDLVGRYIPEKLKAVCANWIRETR